MTFALSSGRTSNQEARRTPSKITRPAAPCQVSNGVTRVFIQMTDDGFIGYSSNLGVVAKEVRNLCVSFHLAGSHVESLPPRVLLTITKLQCMLESKQERIAALERQVEDLMQDRKFLRSQIENLTSTRSMPTFASPSPVTEGQRLNFTISKVYLLSLIA